MDYAAVDLCSCHVKRDCSAKLCDKCGPKGSHGNRVSGARAPVHSWVHVSATAWQHPVARILLLMKVKGIIVLVTI